MMVSANPGILAAVVSCVPSVLCNGTNNDDTMYGTDQSDVMDGLDGNDKIYGNAGGDLINGSAGADTINGGDGDDLLKGRAGNDIIYGGDGNDRLVGDGDINEAGSDIIKAGPGDDKLFQAFPLGFVVGALTSDGFKDVLDCGDGNDEAWVNLSTDHDEVKNCEVVHSG
jgi:Ca2+-binding RTX toxin-like protein